MSENMSKNIVLDIPVSLSSHNSKGCDSDM